MTKQKRYQKQRDSMTLRLPPEINAQTDELTSTVQGISEPFTHHRVSKTQVIEYVLQFVLSDKKPFLSWVIDRIYRKTHKEQ